MHRVINLNDLETHGRALLHALMRYSVQRGAPKCYQNWTPETLSDYFCFHLRQGTLLWVGKLPVIVGTAVAWQVDERVLRHADLSGGYRFDWTVQDPQGDCVFFADIVCSSSEALICLLAEFGQRFPQWKQLKWFTYRRGKLVQLHQRHLTLFLRKVQHVQRQSA